MTTLVHEATHPSRVAYGTTRCDGWPNCGCPNEATESILNFSLCRACARAFIAPDPDYEPVGAACPGCPDCDPMAIIELLGEPARPAYPWCPGTHAPGKCPVAAALTGAPLIAGLKQEIAELRTELARRNDDVLALRAERDELLTLCRDAKETINRLQKRLADAGLLGTSDDLNGFYNGTGIDGVNVQVCMRLLSTLEKYAVNAA